MLQTAIIHCSAKRKPHCIVFHILWCTLLWRPQFKNLYIAQILCKSFMLPHKINVSYHQFLNTLYTNHVKLADIYNDLSFEMLSLYYFFYLTYLFPFQKESASVPKDFPFPNRLSMFAPLENMCQEVTKKMLYHIEFCNFLNKILQVLNLISEVFFSTKKTILTNLWTFCVMTNGFCNVEQADMFEKVNVLTCIPIEFRAYILYYLVFMADHIA